MCSVIFFLRRRRRKQSAVEIDDFGDELPTETQGHPTAPSFLREKKHVQTIESTPDGTLRGSGIADSNIRDAGSSVMDNELRRDVEQLRMVVETLSVQQTQPVNYAEERLPDEPPPMYVIQQ